MNATGFFAAIGAAIGWFFALLWDWVQLLFVVPFRNFDILWILIPLWLGMIFADLFQEKKGTSFGNAISNGLIPLWVGIDWTRTMIRDYYAFNSVFALKVFLSTVVTLYGLIIMIQGIKEKGYILYIGRIRVVTYWLLVLSPLVYGLVQPDWEYFLSIIVFFPLFYYLYEWVDNLLPDSKVVIDESGEKKPSSDLGIAGQKPQTPVQQTPQPDPYAQALQAASVPAQDPYAGADPYVGDDPYAQPRSQYPY